jgi:hypothetical protein
VQLSSIRTGFARLRSVDLKVGAFIGSEHIRQSGISTVDYALDLGGRTLMAGMAIALVQLLAGALFMFDYRLGVYGGLAIGLSLFVAAGYIYPGKLEFLFGMMALSPIAMNACFAGLFGIAMEVSLRVMLPFVTWAIACTACISGISTFLRFVASAFNSRFPAKPKRLESEG